MLNSRSLGPYAHAHPIHEVVQDIIEKVQNHQIWCYNYWTEQKAGNDIIRYEYVLYIEKEKILFYDVLRNYYYTLSGG